MKNKKTLIILCSILVIAFLISIFILDNNDNTLINNPVSTVLTSQPSAKDDFYDYINYKYLSENQLDDDEDVWYLTLTESSKKIKEEKKKIINEILNNCSSYDETSINGKICDFYQSYNVEDNIIKSKNEINSYIDLINSSQNIEQYLNNIYKINSDLSLGLIVNPTINFVPNNLKQYYFSLDALTYDYNIEYSEVYTIEDNIQKKNTVKKYNIEVLTLYGYSENEANKMANNVQKMYSEIARYAIRSDKITEEGYKLFTKNELQNQLENIKLDDFIKNYSNIYLDGNTILVEDINQLKLVDKYLTNENLEILKEYAIIKILTNYSKYISFDFYEIDNKYNDLINGIENKVEEEDFIYDVIYEFFTDTIANEFYKRNFTEKEKKFYTNLVLEEIEAYKVRITNESWLSNETKQSALKKMENMKYTVAVPDNFVYVEDNYKSDFGASYMSKIMYNSKIQIDELINQYKNGNLLYGMDYLEQNAYYEANTNSINILLGWIYSNKLAFNIDDSNIETKYYDVLGTIGFTVGHELSHALDSNGSKYDENGNYINWWTEEDAKNFNNLNINVIKYYNKYNQYGSTTLSENIADLGGMSIVMQIAESNGATVDDYKKLFENYGLIWCSQQTPYYKILLLYYDKHSPDKNRVNAILSSTDKFYEIYNITDKDGMYIPKEDRVSVW